MQIFSGALDRRRGKRALTGEPPRAQLVSRILGTYSEMPGVVLRLDQAARMLGLKFRTCEIVFDALIRTGRLRLTADGQYALP
jgi:hypothetical protein